MPLSWPLPRRGGRGRCWRRHLGRALALALFLLAGCALIDPPLPDDLADRGAAHSVIRNEALSSGARPVLEFADYRLRILDPGTGRGQPVRFDLVRAAVPLYVVECREPMRPAGAADSALAGFWPFAEAVPRYLRCHGQPLEAEREAWWLQLTDAGDGPEAETSVPDRRLAIEAEGATGLVGGGGYRVKAEGIRTLARIARGGGSVWFEDDLAAGERDLVAAIAAALLVAEAMDE